MRGLGQFEVQSALRQDRIKYRFVCTYSILQSGDRDFVDSPAQICKTSRFSVNWVMLKMYIGRVSAWKVRYFVTEANSPEIIEVGGKLTYPI